MLHKRHQKEAISFLQYFCHRLLCSTADGLKKVMRHLPQPVVVVTSASAHARYGIVKRGVTCSSFVSVAVDPPTVSISLFSGNALNDIMEKCGFFAANLLTDSQVHLGIHFAKPVPMELSYSQLETVKHTCGINGLPLIDDSLATIQCKVSKVDRIGDHNIWYGLVVEATSATQGNVQPLLYYQRSYRSIGDEIFMHAFESATMPFDEWTHEAHLRMAWNYICSLGKEMATPMIISGIKNFNQRNAHRIKHGYNETVTQFFIHSITKCVLSMPSNHSFEDFIMCNQHLTDKGYLWSFYSPSLIGSPEAKARFVEPDIRPLV